MLMCSYYFTLYYWAAGSRGEFELNLAKSEVWGSHPKVKPCLRILASYDSGKFSAPSVLSGFATKETTMKERGEDLVHTWTQFATQNLQKNLLNISVTLSTYKFIHLLQNSDFFQNICISTSCKAGCINLIAVKLPNDSGTKRLSF